MTAGKPGLPLANVANHKSERKTHTQLTILPLRKFQNEAHHNLVNHPANTFSYFVPLLGKSKDSAYFKQFTELFQLTNVKWISEPNRGTIMVKTNSQNFTVEELVGMIVRNASDSITRVTQLNVTICVVAIPPFFGSNERFSLWDSLAIGKVIPKRFIDENSAAAVRYVMDGIGIHRGDSHHIFMIINMGAVSTKVSIMEQYGIYKNHIANGVKLLGDSWDKFLGARLFDFILSDILAEKFNALPQRQGSPDIRTIKNKMAMRKILEEAEIVKEKLSEEEVVNVTLNNVIDGVSLNVTITLSL